MSRRIGIVGSRPPHGQDPNEWALYNRIVDAVKAFVALLPEDTVIVSGAAEGVDCEAARAGWARRMRVVEHMPDYTRFPRHVAPLERNTLIANDCHELHAWPSAASRGTWDTVRKARARGIPVTVHRVPS